MQAVYRYFGDDVPLDDVIAEVTPLDRGGTLAVWLGSHALQRGYDATVYTYNLNVFDPTWFEREEVDLAERLEAQVRTKTNRKLREATRAYLEFIALGGELRFEDLTANLIRYHLKRRVPILTGLSATYLYACAREYENEYDDVRGSPVGHFVVLSGYDPKRRTVRLADPLHDNPRFGTPYYTVSIDRLVAAILLGIVTYDANLLVITPRVDAAERERHAHTRRR